jgi:putative DNA methylase
MTWDFAEGNPFSSSSGNFFRQVELMGEVVALALPASIAGDARQADASAQLSAHNCTISTDPPYYDNIAYADLSDFFYVWLRRSLKPVLPELFATISVPKAEELVATPYRHGGKQQAAAFFLDGMTKAMQQIALQAHPAVPVTIYYAFKQSETETEGTGSTGWETFLKAVLDAGFAVVGTWPMRTELGNRMIGSGTNALASSIILVCRKSQDDATTVARKDFARELDRALPVAIAEMTGDPIAAVAPVDLAQACIGPGMALFSKHKAVLEADGAAMTVHNALVHINKAIDDYFSHAEGDLDADTRFCIGWFEQFGFDTGTFGVADVLARAKGTSVDGVKEAGVIETGKGKVRLFRLTEYPKGWDPTKDNRVPVWEACHHMCRALGESEAAAGALLAKMPQKQEAIRLLAYRLYTLCERKKWAEQAGPYNELITSWPAIVDASHGVGHVGTQMDLV